MNIKKQAIAKRCWRTDKETLDRIGIIAQANKKGKVAIKENCK